jgi:hypothetical protein
MKICEGAYYRTRDGYVVGPMRRSLASIKDSPWYSNFNSWRVDGHFYKTGDEHGLDLISEVYVSDTPPAVQKTEDKWRARLLAAGPGPFIEVQETKTLRDEFVMRLMDRDMFAVGFKDEAEQLYRVADALMEARKK